MEKKDIFSYRDYQDFLNDRIRVSPKRGHGQKSAFATAAGCQVTYVTRVLKGKAHLSLEQAHAIGRYLGLSEHETDYFLLLVQRARAGAPMLRNYFENKIQILRAARLNLEERFKVSAHLRSEFQHLYYSSWHYAAIHVLACIPAFQEVEGIAKRLDLSRTRVSEVVESLLDMGLIQKEGNRFFPTEKRIHLGANSPNIVKHHSHWRLRGIASIEKYEKDSLGLHYSSVASVSEEDFMKIKHFLVSTLEKYNGLVEESKAEDLYCLGLDWYRV